MRRLWVVIVAASLLSVVLLATGVLFLRVQAERVSAVQPVNGVDELYYGRNLMVDLFGAKVGDEVILFGGGIDTTGAALDSFLAELDSRREQVRTVVVSHGHPDHIGGIPHLPAARVYAGALDVDLMEGNVPNRTFVQDVLGVIFIVGTATATDPLTGPREIPVGDGGEAIYAIPFPGHTPGSYAFLFRGALFVGDAFEYVGGQLVLPAPDAAVDNDQMLDSIIALPQLLQRHELSVICPGHGDGGCTPPEETSRLLRELVAQAQANRGS